jgi:hypothetical protein
MGSRCVNVNYAQTPASPIQSRFLNGICMSHSASQLGNGQCRSVTEDTDQLVSTARYLEQTGDASAMGMLVREQAKLKGTPVDQDESGSRAIKSDTTGEVSVHSSKSVMEAIAATRTAGEQPRQHDAVRRDPDPSGHAYEGVGLAGYPNLRTLSKAPGSSLVPSSSDRLPVATVERLPVGAKACLQSLVVDGWELSSIVESHRIKLSDKVPSPSEYPQTFVRVAFSREQAETTGVILPRIEGLELCCAWVSNHGRRKFGSHVEFASAIAGGGYHFAGQDLRGYATCAYGELRAWYVKATDETKLAELNALRLAAKNLQSLPFYSEGLVKLFRETAELKPIYSTRLEYQRLLQVLSGEQRLAFILASGIGKCDTLSYAALHRRVVNGANAVQKIELPSGDRSTDNFTVPLHETAYDLSTLERIDPTVLCDHTSLLFEHTKQEYFERWSNGSVVVESVSASGELSNELERVLKDACLRLRESPDTAKVIEVAKQVREATLEFLDSPWATAPLSTDIGRAELGAYAHATALEFKMLSGHVVGSAEAASAVLDLAKRHTSFMPISAEAIAAFANQSWSSELDIKPILAHLTFHAGSELDPKLRAYVLRSATSGIESEMPRLLAAADTMEAKDYFEESSIREQVKVLETLDCWLKKVEHAPRLIKLPRLAQYLGNLALLGLSQSSTAHEVVTLTAQMIRLTKAIQRSGLLNSTALSLREKLDLLYACERFNIDPPLVSPTNLAQTPHRTITSALEIFMPHIRQRPLGSVGSFVYDHIDERLVEACLFGGTKQKNLSENAMLLLDLVQAFPRLEQRMREMVSHSIAKRRQNSKDPLVGVAFADLSALQQRDVERARGSLLCSLLDREHDKVRQLSPLITNELKSELSKPQPSARLTARMVEDGIGSPSWLRYLTVRANPTAVPDKSRALIAIYDPRLVSVASARNAKLGEFLLTELESGRLSPSILTYSSDVSEKSYLSLTDATSAMDSRFYPDGNPLRTIWASLKYQQEHTHEQLSTNIQELLESVARVTNKFNWRSTDVMSELNSWRQRHLAWIPEVVSTVGFIVNVFARQRLGAGNESTFAKLYVCEQESAFLEHQRLKYIELAANRDVVAGAILPHLMQIERDIRLRPRKVPKADRKLATADSFSKSSSFRIPMRSALDGARPYTFGDSWATVDQYVLARSGEAVVRFGRLGSDGPQILKVGVDKLWGLEGGTAVLHKLIEDLYMIRQRKLAVTLQIEGTNRCFDLKDVANCSASDCHRFIAYASWFEFLCRVSGKLYPTDFKIF